MSDDEAPQPFRFTDAHVQALLTFVDAYKVAAIGHARVVVTKDACKALADLPDIEDVSNTEIFKVSNL